MDTSQSQSEVDVVMGEEGPGRVCRGRRWRANSPAQLFGLLT